jgi:release factor glutamine methyltransferase
MSAAEALAGAAAELEAGGVDSPRLDAELLLSRALGSSRAALYRDRDRRLTPAEGAAFEAMVRRRAAREPLAYILGEWGFRRLTLSTDARALVPRPETEVVVERCLALLEAVAAPVALDVGTGSGAIALALADEHPTIRVRAIDSSPAAVELAQENVARLGLESRVSCEVAEARSLSGAFDLVASNPPYVGADEMDGLQPEVRDWEPRGAFVGSLGPEDVAGLAFDLLRDGGWLVVEIGHGHGARVASTFARRGYADVRVSPDLAGRERVVEGRRP